MSVVKKETHGLASSCDVVIVGGGAAGLMCAATAASRGRSVTIIDHANKVGKKILMSGGGRCNFTNLWADPSHYLSDNPHFCKSALSRYTQWDFLELVQQHQLSYHEKKLGQLFCDHSSKDMLSLLLAECDTHGVVIHTRCSVDRIHSCDTSTDDASTRHRYQLQTSYGEIQCRSLVIATGGLSIPTMGATGFGYRVAEQFGLSVKPLRAALVPFTLQPFWLEKTAHLSGSSIAVTIRCNNQSFTENLLFTHRGLSGPAVLQISSYWQPGETVTIQLLPEIDWLAFLQQGQAEKPNTELKNWLAQVMAKQMADTFCQWWCDSKPLKQLSKKHLQGLAQQLSHWEMVPSGTEGYRTAEVTIGGVDTDGISSKTFEAKRQPGLFFIGEVLDVTGHLGGFNFQWAWSSAVAAGQVV